MSLVRGEEEEDKWCWSFRPGVVEKRSHVWRVRSVNVVGEEQGDTTGKVFSEES